jgi:hypothetical protein
VGAGWADGITFGVTKHLRRIVGVDDVINYQSSGYQNAWGFGRGMGIGLAAINPFVTGLAVAGTSWEGVEKWQRGDKVGAAVDWVGAGVMTVTMPVPRPGGPVGPTARPPSASEGAPPTDEVPPAPPTGKVPPAPSTGQSIDPNPTGPPATQSSPPNVGVPQPGSRGFGKYTVTDPWGNVHDYIPPEEWPLWFPDEPYPFQWFRGNWSWPDLP